MSVCNGLQVIVQPWKINQLVRTFFQFNALHIKEVQKIQTLDNVLKDSLNRLENTDIERFMRAAFAQQFWTSEQTGCLG